MDHHDLLSGLVRLHVLHHAAQHGYRLSAGTLYPMLAKMTRDGYLTCSEEREGRTLRKYYTITDRGREGLALARRQLHELKDEAG
ncbi:PadR family transcriptional regulator [Cereibacter sediminicola]|uniref:PadR family transcriptional regulator n=1 Tax=Cereibacter sediminicola TaxID=2584941 RepID=UPI00119DEBF7|nr:PadR family transcriptional regulator [Cereibacter sediminicola]